MAEIYVSTDVEADGPCPGVHSMLSFASVALDPRVGAGRAAIVSTFSANLETLPDASPDPATTKWWAGQPEAWAACRRDAESPAVAIARYVEWLDALPGKPVFVAYPAGFDFTYVYWYLHRFAGRSPFGFSALDSKSFAMALLRTGFRDSTKKRFPRQWLPPDAPHTHVALDDAIEQGLIFLAMLAHRDTR